MIDRGIEEQNIGNYTVQCITYQFDAYDSKKITYAYITVSQCLPHADGLQFDNKSIRKNVNLLYASTFRYANTVMGSMHILT